ncbi:undecaprenyl-diphosphate phosphatase [Dehalobacter sp. TeCB1]|uniref:undecaprenyl-diphosphate phosphatase n=1 Tax=Dehalobacter sp. TeCB1 TaxID=1843715 RepID=UPI00083A3110|nr:undecaprenyl-diphosphate phosphatase [Dehalobacter sp. TeCB1]OCZ49831.1 UDP-diphosphatase [Dehalobacter sp. TeCB1]
MSILQAIIYGIVQGIGEFLPISSTAHLVLVPWLFNWQDPGLVFDVALHLGTAAAVILFFIKDWLRLIKAGLTKPKSQDGRLFWLIVLATVPGALFGVILDKYMQDFRNAALIGVMLIIMGIILYTADKYSPNKIDIKETGIKRSVLIGLAQVFAVIPGVSRSGITMTAGRLLGMTRESIAKFTFLLSAPIILGDALYHAKGILHTHIDKAPFLTAMITAAVVGALSIKFLLNYLKTKGFAIFAVYRFVLGALVIAIYFIR